MRCAEQNPSGLPNALCPAAELPWPPGSDPPKIESRTGWPAGSLWPQSLGARLPRASRGAASGHHLRKGHSAGPACHLSRDSVFHALSGPAVGWRFLLESICLSKWARQPHGLLPCPGPSAPFKGAQQAGDPSEGPPSRRGPVTAQHMQRTDSSLPNPDAVTSTRGARDGKSPASLLKRRGRPSTRVNSQR